MEEVAAGLDQSHSPGGDGPPSDQPRQQSMSLSRSPSPSNAEMTAEDQHRYSCFANGRLDRASVREVIEEAVPGAAVSEYMVIVAAGSAKVFLGQVVEACLARMAEEGVSGPIPPEIFGEVVDTMRARGRLPAAHKRPRLFRK